MMETKYYFFLFSVYNEMHNDVEREGGILYKSEYINCNELFFQLLLIQDIF